LFIDIHVHAIRIPGPRQDDKPCYATPQQIIERYDELGIEKRVILPIVNPECAYVSQSNEEVIEMARETDRFVPFCNIDPRAMTNSSDAPLGDLLRHYRDQGCKGIGEICANLPFSDPMIRNLFKHAQDMGLPLIFHVAPQIGNGYGLFDDPGLPQLEFSLQSFPRLIFLGHSQPFWAEIAPLETVGARAGYPEYPIREEGAVPKLMRRYPNLYGDLSATSGYNALARDAVYAVEFLNEFQDRLLFGTDICAPDTPTPLVDFLVKLKKSNRITESVFRKIARENAVKLLEL
jgi:predicted TIM-barrel fold metal-dependent hydrolase